ncbi:MAG: macrophage infectivity potentiator [Chlamydiota bacterium]|jgi:peptidylprolyl isomerase
MHLIRNSALSLLILATPLVAKEDIAKISEAMGHLIGKNLQTLGLPLDMEALLVGLKESVEGKDPPLDEEATIEAMSAIQEASFALAAEENLQHAEEFLSHNASKEGVVALEDGKLQFTTKKTGSGREVQAYNSPLLKYKGHTLEGRPLPETEEVVSLAEAIPGFAKGVTGMKEGEVRILYIHPSLGYGKNNPLSPNALLIFEVEVEQADAPATFQEEDIIPFIEK